jgi:oxygen-independent coproporphyrinogen-3 oxidase
VSEFGVYFHYPFCISKCPYCDFATVGNSHPDSVFADRYAEAVRRELDLRLKVSPGLRGRNVSSVYFGGGTPSLADASCFGEILNAVASSFDVPPGAEITLEANPGASDRERFSGFRDAGINRLSIGVQSFSEKELQALGRVHSPDDARNALRAARDAGFGNLGADLIFAIPGQSLDDFKNNLDELIRFRPEHISVYGLTLYEGTEFHRLSEAGEIVLPDEDEQAEMFLAARSHLQAAGYEHYEISNYALPGWRSRHNSLYWNQGDWLGLGPAAHSSIGGDRFENPDSIREWLGAIDSGVAPSIREEKPDAQAGLGEAIMLGLRQAKGVCLEELAERFGSQQAEEASRKFEPLIQEGLAESSDSRRFLTERGLLVADTIMASFF